jgi:hypothetical protein
MSEYYEEEYDEEFDYELEIEQIQEDYRKKRLKEAVIGPAISTMFHFILIVLLCIFLIDTVSEPIAEIEITLQDIEIVELEELIPEEIPEPKDPEVSTINDLATSIPDIITETNEVATPEDSDIDTPTIDDDIPFDDISDVKISDSAFATPMTGGRSDGGKNKGRKSNGANDTITPQKVALKWLIDHQNPDGSWGTSQHGGLTGLAMLALLADGETPSSKRYGKNMKLGIQWMIKAIKDGSAKSSHSYGYAICTYALADAYALTGIYAIEDALNIAVDKIVKGQSPNGGFDYDYKHSDRNDLSFGGWNIQALKAAYMAGIEHPGLVNALDKSLKGVDLLYSNIGEYDGGFAYSTGKGPKSSMTAVGALCKSLLGNKDNKFDRAYSYISTKSIEKIAWKGNSFMLYEWYYATQVMFFEDGKLWKKWDKKMKPMLLKNQFKDGHWESPSARESAGHGLDAINGKVYSTALCSLMLAVYYRILPSTKMKPPKKVEAKIIKEEGLDLLID